MQNPSVILAIRKLKEFREFLEKQLATVNKDIISLEWNYFPTKKERIFPTLEKDGYEWDIIKVDPRYNERGWKTGDKQVDLLDHQITEVLSK